MCVHSAVYVHVHFVHTSVKFLCMCTTRHFEVVSQLASNASLCIKAPELLQGREDSLQHRENEGGLSMQQKQFY